MVASRYARGSGRRTGEMAGAALANDGQRKALAFARMRARAIGSRRVSSTEAIIMRADGFRAPGMRKFRGARGGVLGEQGDKVWR